MLVTIHAKKLSLLKDGRRGLWEWRPVDIDIELEDVFLIHEDLPDEDNWLVSLKYRECSWEIDEVEYNRLKSLK